MVHPRVTSCVPTQCLTAHAVPATPGHCSHGRTAFTLSASFSFRLTAVTNLRYIRGVTRCVLAPLSQRRLTSYAVPATPGYSTDGRTATMPRAFGFTAVDNLRYIREVESCGDDVSPCANVPPQCFSTVCVFRDFWRRLAVHPQMVTLTPQTPCTFHLLTPKHVCSLAAWDEPPLDRFRSSSLLLSGVLVHPTRAPATRPSSCSDDVNPCANVLHQCFSTACVFRDFERQLAVHPHTVTPTSSMPRTFQLLMPRPVWSMNWARER